MDGNNIKLCDFGSSCRFTDSITISTSIIQNGNQLQYFFLVCIIGSKSPSLKRRLSEKEIRIALLQEDVYAFGVIVMEVILGENEIMEYGRKTNPNCSNAFMPHPSLKKDLGLSDVITLICRIV